MEKYNIVIYFHNIIKSLDFLIIGFSCLKEEKPDLAHLGAREREVE